ncbi:ASCH domain-containing protein [Shimia sp. SDUM112013]|uniref:ASCH domain-containing protein n=1 Tax=Shimia sp. SDUM112013 TaxID=3136160 RepID=UPI0032EBBAB5
MESEKAGALLEGAECYRPGDCAEMNAEILSLMRSGAKTMTCEAWSVYEDGLEALPVVGRVDIALDWQGRAALAVRTLQVEKLRYDEMTADRVAAQGEFRDLEDWKRGYKAVLTRAGRFAPDVPLMVETFEVVQDLGDHTDVQ